MKTLLTMLLLIYFSISLYIVYGIRKPVLKYTSFKTKKTKEYREIEPQHEISNNVVCATSKASDQAAHMRSLIRAFASRLHIL